MGTKSIKIRIKEYFTINPLVQLRVRQIERLVKVPIPSAIRYTKELEQEGFLKKTKIANITLFSANRSSKFFLIGKTSFNFKSLFESGLVDFLIKALSNPTIVVFGSYSRGEDVETSDIDLYIETSTKTKLDLKKFEKKLQRKIQIFSYSNIKKVENKELANNMLNGIVLNGFLEVF